MDLKKVVGNALGQENAAKHIDYLDGWRGIAILLVLFAHFFVDGYLPLLFIGELGVNIFFVLSGMLMSNILFVKRTNLSTFYKRRISRILPAFLAFVCLSYLVAYLQGKPESSNFIYTLLFLRTYLPVDSHIWETGIAVGHLWSLNIEEHAYLFLSALTLLPCFRGREYWVLIPLGCVSILIHLFYKLFPSIAPTAGVLQTEAAASFILISAGLFLIREKLEPFVKGWMIPCAFLAVFVISYFRGSWLITPFFLAFCVNYLHKAPELFLNLLRLPFVRLMGVLSFSIYLWQQPFYVYGLKFVAENTLLEKVFYLICAIAVGVVSYCVIEGPSRKWLNKKW